MSEPVVWPKDLVDYISARTDLMTFMKDLRVTMVEDLPNLMAQYDLYPSPEWMPLIEAKARPSPTGEAVPSYSQQLAAHTKLPAKARVYRAQFYAAAVLCGAKYRQIGRLMGVSHQSVHVTAGKELGKNFKYVVNSPATDEQVAAMKREWEKDPFRTIPELVVKFRDIIMQWRD